MHRYYAHALAAVFAHEPGYSVYVVRHPFPPYATHYVALLGIARIASFDWAEKIVTCGTLLCFAFSLRRCATAVGPAGEWITLLIAPLLLPWYLFMGFYNYSIGLGVALLAASFYLRAQTKWLDAAGYSVSLMLLAVSHPVPLLLLLLFVISDLVRRLILQPSSPHVWLGTNRHALGLLVLTLIVCAYPAMAIDRTKTTSTIDGIHFHFQFARSVLLLTGMSPYNSRSASAAVQGYRFVLYALLLIALFLAARPWRSVSAMRGHSVAAAFLVYALGFAIALPFIPDVVNGSRFFAMRLTVVIWVCAILAAAGSSVQANVLPGTCKVLGMVFTILTLLPAEQVLRPIARDMFAIEHQQVPLRSRAVLLDGPGLPNLLRTKYDLVFDPFLWANVLPLVDARNIVMDAPWIDQTITPLRPAPGSPVAANANKLMEIPAYDPPPRFNTILPMGEADAMLRSSSILMYAGTERELGVGLGDFLGSREASKFHCTRVTVWALTCIRKGV